MTEDFYHLLMETPDAERHGRVFKLDGLQTRTPITPKRVCRMVSKIGQKAGVIVATTEKRQKDKETGKPITVTVKKFASCHDLRRAFGTRWSKRVMPATLKRLMRHAEVATTMKFYITMDADEVADELWGKNWDSGNKLATGNNRGNKAPSEPQETETAPAESSTEAVELKEVT